ncbi:response regulator [Pedobacter sp. V48]|uniref:response regulator transcription factor n=1 Tax=Pedobacter sp. V48 TaxID=509635 RepID=UPI0003E4CBBC|nr:response regulator [Pedobacter sp. V48]ETZ19174.1 hypothetical protein N824_10560 [Pedobacter sp. V48]
MKSSILIIDDNQDLLDFLSRIFRERYRVHIAINADVAQDILSRERVELIISDIMMPGMDGFELCRFIKLSHKYNHIPVVLLTSKNTYAAQIDGLKVGADAYIQKPFQIEFLQLQVANLLINREHVKQHASGLMVIKRGLAPSKLDSEFLAGFKRYVLENIKNPNIDIDELAVQMNMSRATFYRKVRLLFVLSPYQAINSIRLEKAAELIAANQFTFQQISQMTGYSSATVFSKKFKAYFKVSPSTYLETLSREKT